MVTLQATTHLHGIPPGITFDTLCTRRSPHPHPLLLINHRVSDQLGIRSSRAGERFARCVLAHARPVVDGNGSAYGLARERGEREQQTGLAVGDEIAGAVGIETDNRLREVE